MTLLESFLDIAGNWRGVFPPARSHLRATRQTLGSLVCYGAGAVWSGWPSMIPACARRAGAFGRLSTSAIRCRRRFIGT